MSVFSKLQIRALILLLISKSNSLIEPNNLNFALLYKEIENIDDVKTIVDVIIKEYPKVNEIESQFCIYILKQLKINEYIYDKIVSFIKVDALSDNLKYKYIELLSELNLKNKLKDIPFYFDNPEKIVDIETKKLMERAEFNPEAMLDFLDFISSVSDEDAIILLESLSQDFKGNPLANIIYPILYSDFSDNIKLKVIDILSESKSSLSVAPFEYLIEVSENTDIINACKSGLKKLKLSGVNKEQAQEYLKNIIKAYKPMECYSTIPDGAGSQAILITRADDNGRYIILALVISDNLGIMDCFGFYNIKLNEVLKIVAKFYKTEGKYKVNTDYIKYRVNKAIEKTISDKKLFPYEYICWSNVISDFNTIESIPEKFINDNCSLIDLNKDFVLSFLTNDYTLRWFISPSDNKGIMSIVDYIYSLDDLDINLITNFAKNKINEVFDDVTLINWKSKFYNLIYILVNNNLVQDANVFYTILKTENLFALFKSIIVQRSIFSYFVKENENLKETERTSNIFRKKNLDENKLDKAKINAIINVLKKNWING